MPTKVVGEARNGVEALELLPASGAQVLLLDIQMPGMGGLELARHLARPRARRRAVVFVTAHDQHAVEAFELNALDYLLKPVRAERLAAALKKAQPSRAESASSWRSARRMRRASTCRSPSATASCCVPVRDILFLRAEQKYVTVRTRGARAPDRGVADRARARVRHALRAHPPQLPGGARRDPRLRARGRARRTSRTGWWCSTGWPSACR